MRSDETGDAPLVRAETDGRTKSAVRTVTRAERFRRMRLGLLCLAVIALFAMGSRLGGSVVAFADWIEGLGALAPMAFIIAYAVATVAFVPGSLLTLAAGAVFGLAAGSVYVLVGAVLGSSSAFLVARYLVRAPIEARVARDARFAAVDRAIGREGRRIVFLLRLSPVFPYNLLNYALGLTRVRFADYLVASVGMIPGTFLYVYTGRVVGDVAALAAGAAIDRGAGYYGLLAVGFAATALVTAYVTRLARGALREVER